MLTAIITGVAVSVAVNWITSKIKFKQIDAKLAEHDAKINKTATDSLGDL